MSYRVPSYEADSLCFGEKSTRLEGLAKELRGPAYVYDLAQAERRAKALQDAFSRTRLFYAMKANPHPSLLRVFSSIGLGADVVSGGEIRRALECGFAPSAVVFSGVGKTIDEIDLALRSGVHQINVESVPELERIARRAAALDVKAPVAFRLNPDVDIKTHPYIATGLKENKFGLEIAALPAIEELLQRNQRHLLPVGVSLHLGSMMMGFEGLGEALSMLKPVFLELRARWPTMKRFDAGGGLGVLYDRDDPAEEDRMLKDYSATILGKVSAPDIELQLEPGRWLVAHAGTLLAQVQYLKKTSDRNFLVLNAGMNHLLRPALYQARHRILPLRSWPERQRVLCDVVGPICESADVLGRGFELPELREHDWVAILDSGAYGASMASTYNLQELPQEICL